MNAHTQDFDAKALYPRVSRVIPPIEWSGYVPDIEAILRLKRERDAVILAHNYMTPEIYHCVADVVGDSLALAKAATEIEARVIVMAGVHFMAETAKLMNPEKVVLIPDTRAGCSLATSIGADDVRALRRRHPGVPIVAYVNTTAAVKAEVDICCTSANARAVVESLGAPRVVMLPDKFLAANVAKTTDVEIISWDGACEVHEGFSAGDVRELRSVYPDAIVLAHPECPPEVVAAADFAGSTAQMSAFVAERRPRRALLLTECSMGDNIAGDNPEVEFLRPCGLCPHMKRITLLAIRRALETMTTAIEIDPAVAARARRAVERMTAL
jgi:quinolinate synthase